MDVWTEEIDVALDDVDKSNRIKPSAVFNFFQRATTHHGDVLGIGANAMAANGQGWVLSRFSAQIERRSSLSERLNLSTWPRGFKKLFATRDYLLTDKEGSVVTRARSEWLLIDIKKRRPLREESLCTPLPRNETMADALRGPLPVLHECAGMTKAGIIVPAYSDADYNGHVNNVRYIEWTQNYADNLNLMDASKIYIDINYIHEILPRESVEIYTYSEGNLIEIEAKSLKEGVSVFRSRLCAACR
ncbi:MAG: acyl-ACP thioesterase [Spirochaetaceae bacterium]|jgi:acyl-ACP thioesterase|nr:acyl-ACP thioesterase [Spirochaetaceae bacterium]